VPHDVKVDFINRKGSLSMLVQVVADDRHMFLDIFAGHAGANHDATVLKNSPIYHLAGRGQMFSPGEYILGDPAYPLLLWLLVPFKDDGHLTDAKLRYNHALSRLRINVECTLGETKGRWRSLLSLRVPLDLAPHWILACATLHNVCKLHNDCWVAPVDLDE